MKFIFIIISNLFIFTTLIFCGETQNDDSEFDNKSPFLLEKKVEELISEQRSIIEKISVLEDLQSSINKWNVNEKWFYKEIKNLEKRIIPFKKKLDEILDKKDEELINIHYLEDTVYKYIQDLSYVNIEIPNTYDFLRQIQSSYNRNSLKFNFINRILLELKLDYYYIENLYELGKDYFGLIYNLQINLKNEEKIQIGKIKKILREIEDKLNNYPNYFKNKLEKYTTELLTQKDKLKNNINFQLKGLKEKHDNIDKKLEILNEKLTKQVGLDRDLIVAIYFMIAALVMLFLGLRVFPDKIAIILIEKRSLVEVISMAFILITIIILGTGDRLGKETLGTLLGTIAGYIFGSRLGHEQSEKHQENEKKT